MAVTIPSLNIPSFQKEEEEKDQEPTGAPTAKFLFSPTSGTSQSTPAATSGPGTVDFLKGLIFKPTEVRPPFALPGQEQEIKGTAPAIVADVTSRIIEAVPRIAAITVSNIKTLRSGKPEATPLSFDARRLGLEESVVRDSGTRLIQEFDRLEEEHPGRTAVNIGIATLKGPVIDALDAFFVGDILTKVAQAGLARTGFNPSVRRSLQQLGLEGQPVTAEAIKNEFVERGTRILESGLPERQIIQQMDELGRATDDVIRALADDGIPQLNRVGKLVQDASRTALEDIRRLPLIAEGAAEIAPRIPRVELPGFRRKPGQAPAFGLSTEEIEAVGRGATTRALTRVPKELEPLAQRARTFATAEAFLQATKTLPFDEIGVAEETVRDVLFQGLTPESGRAAFEKAVTDFYEVATREADGFTDAEVASFDELAQMQEELSITDVLNDIRTGSADPKVPRFTRQQVEEVRVQLDLMREAVESHPARGLQRFMHTRGDFAGGLPEVTGKGPSRFAREGDDIVTEFGFESSEEARSQFAEYRQLRSEFLEAKQSFRTDIAAARSFQELENAKNKLLTKARAVERKAETGEIQHFKNSILKEMNSALPKRGRDAILKGKFDAETQNKINKIRDVMFNMDREKAMNKIAKNIAKYTAEDGTPKGMPDKVIEENELLNMAGLFRTKPFGSRASNAREIGLKGLKDMLESIQMLKATGRTRREAWNFNKTTGIQRIQERALDVVTGGRGSKPGAGITPDEIERFGTIRSPIRNYLDAHRGIDFQLEYLSRFDKTSEPLDSFLHKAIANKIHKARNIKNQGIRENEELLQKKFGEIFGVEPRSKSFVKEVNEQLKPFTVTKLNDPVTGKEIELNMNRFQLRKKWMEMQDATLLPTFELTMGWDSTVRRAIEAELTEADLKFAEWQLNDFYPKYREGINDKYEELYGVTMGNIKNYSPIKRKVQDDIPEHVQLINDLWRQASTKPGSIKGRTQNIAALEFTGDMEAFEKHIIEMEHFKAYSDVVSDTRRILTGDLKTAIKDYHGAEVMRNLDGAIDDIARDGIEWRKRFDFLEKARSNFTVSALSVNPTIMLKQLTSIPAYLVEMPIGSFFRGLADFWTAPRAKARFLLENSETLKARYSMGSFDRDVKLAFSKQATVDKFVGKKGFKEQIMSLVTIGDRGAILIGGWGNYVYNLEKALGQSVPTDVKSIKKIAQENPQAHAKAMEQFERATKRTQQAGDPEDLGAIQRAGSFGNLFTMFMTTPIQYWRVTEAAARNLGLFEAVGGSAKRGTRTSNLKKLFVMWVVLPMLFQWVADGFEIREKRQKRAAILGPLGYPVILGDFLDTIARAVSGDDIFPDTYTPAALTALGSLGKDVVNAIDGEDVYETVEDLAITTGKLTGLPVKQFDEFVRGLLRFVSGATNDIRELFFTNYALDKDRRETKKSRDRVNAIKDTGSITIPSIEIPSIEIPSLSI